MAAPSGPTLYMRGRRSREDSTCPLRRGVQARHTSGIPYASSDYHQKWTRITWGCRAGANELKGFVPHGVLLRSEEHTSELQSRFDLVCRLLLEKKKNTNIDT